MEEKNDSFLMPKNELLTMKNNYSNNVNDGINTIILEITDVSFYSKVYLSLKKSQLYPKAKAGVSDEGRSK